MSPSPNVGEESTGITEVRDLFLRFSLARLLSIIRVSLFLCPFSRLISTDASDKLLFLRFVCVISHQLRSGSPLIVIHLTGIFSPRDPIKRVDTSTPRVPRTDQTDSPLDSRSSTSSSSALKASPGSVVIVALCVTIAGSLLFETVCTSRDRRGCEEKR